MEAKKHAHCFETTQKPKQVEMTILNIGHYAGNKSRDLMVKHFFQNDDFNAFAGS